MTERTCDTCGHMMSDEYDPDPGACGSGTLTEEYCGLPDDQLTEEVAEAAERGECPCWIPIEMEDDVDPGDFLDDADDEDPEKRPCPECGWKLGRVEIQDTVLWFCPRCRHGVEDIPEPARTALTDLLDVFR